MSICASWGQKPQSPKPNLIPTVDVFIYVFTIFHPPYAQQFAYPHLPAAWKVTNLFFFKQDRYIGCSFKEETVERFEAAGFRINPLGLIWAPGPRTEDSAVDYNIISNLRFDVHHWAHPQKRPGAWEQPGNIWERLTRGPPAMTMDG